MLELNKDKIINSGGKIINVKRKKNTSDKSFCSTYVTPKDVIDYYNNPNRCVNCGRIIPARGLTDYIKLKSRIFCSNLCSNEFFNLKGIDLLHNKLIFSFYKILEHAT